MKHLAIVALLLVAALQAPAQNKNTKSTNLQKMELKTYVIERDIPNAGKLTAADLKQIAIKSCNTLKGMSANIQWVHTYVTGNKFFCIYKAENEELVREHAKRGEFPITRIYEVANIFSPATAEQ